jgi:hypothetical protein
LNVSAGHRSLCGAVFVLIGVKEDSYTPLTRPPVPITR